RASVLRLVRLLGRRRCDRRSRRRRLSPLVTCTSKPESLPQLTRHPPTDLQRRLAAAQLHEVLSIGIALDSFEKARAHQRIAMNAHKVRRPKLILERAQ